MNQDKAKPKMPLIKIGAKYLSMYDNATQKNRVLSLTVIVLLITHAFLVFNHSTLEERIVTVVKLPNEVEYGFRLNKANLNTYKDYAKDYLRTINTINENNVDNNIAEFKTRLEPSFAQKMKQPLAEYASTIKANHIRREIDFINIIPEPSKDMQNCKIIANASLNVWVGNIKAKTNQPCKFIINLATKEGVQYVTDYQANCE